MSSITLSLETVQWEYLKEVTRENPLSILVTSIAMSYIGYAVFYSSPPITQFFGACVMVQSIYFYLPIICQIMIIQKCVWKEISRQCNPDRIIRLYIVETIRNDPGFQELYQKVGMQVRGIARVVTSPYYYVKSWFS